jgi:hypothetical protein
VLTSRVTRIGRQDGAGMATAAVCDRPPALVSLLRNGTER